MDTSQTGSRGESLAAEFLRQRRGYAILARNWRSGRLELDIVARDGPTIVFVEVKTRRLGPQPAEEGLGSAQRRRLRRAAAAWIRSHSHPAGEYRFDLVAVTLRRDAPPILHHIREAFTGDDE